MLLQPVQCLLEKVKRHLHQFRLLARLAEEIQPQDVISLVLECAGRIIIIAALRTAEYHYGSGAGCAMSRVVEPAQVVACHRLHVTLLSYDTTITRVLPRYFVAIVVIRDHPCQYQAQRHDNTDATQ